MREEKSKWVVNRGLLGMWWRAKASWGRHSIELQADGAHPHHDGATSRYRHRRVTVFLTVYQPLFGTTALPGKPLPDDST